MRIGEVAELSSIPASTLRYYEQIGLIARPKRIHGIRDYAPEILQTLRIIKLAQSTGFTLAEIKAWISLMDKTTPDQPAITSDWRDFVKTKMIEVKHLISQYQEVLQLLQQVSSCPCESPTTCTQF
ncbi:MAG: MerR family transcriptional regulator [Aggregatilineales bacterium]